MSTLLTCPNCGPRNIYDFRFGGELLHRPPPDAPNADLTAYLYNRQNAHGPQTEWWNHTLGCRRWFIATRDTTTNTILETHWPDQHPNPPPPSGP